MAGWSMTADLPSLDCSGIPEKSSASCIDLEPSSEGSVVKSETDKEGSVVKSEPDKLRFWFNKFLGYFLKEICSQSCIWPLPPMLGDGKPVDLLKLFLVVREKGGYNAVSQSGLWGLVTKEFGLGLDVASSIKLVYVKYLVSLERWLENIVESDDLKGESNFNGLMMELGTELKEFLMKSRKKIAEYSQVEDSVVEGSEQGEKCAKDGKSVHINLTQNVYKGGQKSQNIDDLTSVVVDSDGAKNTKCIDAEEYEDTPSDLAKSVVNSSEIEKMSNEDEVKSAVKKDYMECKMNTENDNSVILELNDIKENFPSRKRKRDSMWTMLNWVTEVAKDPCDPVLGSLPEISKWKSYGSEELWKQVLLFRDLAFLRKENHSSADQSICQKSQKMHPCMYEDKPSAYKLRERSSGTKKMASDGQDYSQSSSEKLSDFDSSMVGTGKQSRGTCDSTSPGSVFNYDADVCVPIGPYFQAELPEWTGVASESDPKWLGTRTWPMDKKENRCLIERDRIGKGRQDSCGCHIQDSIQCVQFHVVEKRSKVKLELGSAFKQWKFDKMGEEVAIGWKEEDQRKFYCIVKSNQSSENGFWDEIYKCFPEKSREELVSYYYNVFILQRRAYQNRITPTNTNSDDDEESQMKSNRHNLLATKKSKRKQEEESNTKTEKKFKRTTH